MASAGSRSWLTRCRLTRSWLTRRWLTRAWRTCVLAAVAASLAGCVGMPNSGSPGTFSATPQDTSQDSDFIGAVPAGPQSGWKPSDIVTGYLNATVSYPAYSAIAEKYLANPSSKNWAPNWSGQYVGGQQVGHGTQTEQQFTLVKQGKQWRITDPPKNRMLTEPDFAQVYKPQDLYFYDSIGQVLVPDAVFVPTGTPSTSLATNLVTALLANPQPVWLQGQGNPTPAAITAFPPPSSAKDISVTVDGNTATVKRTGVAASANSVARHQMAAQLVWTLTGPPGSPPGIQAVQLEFNGKPWTPGTPPCPGGEQGITLKEAMYECKNPYPLAASSTFYYVANGQAWSRCASETQVTTGMVGSVQPVFSRTGAVTLGRGCTSLVQATSAPSPPAQPRTVSPLSMVAVSPDGKYLAGVGRGGTPVTWGPSGATKPYSTLPLSDVTAISWDRQDYLWAAHGNTTTMIVPNGNDNPNHAAIANDVPSGAKILGLSIAPDGVRVAAIVHTDSGSEVELAAINNGKPDLEAIDNGKPRTGGSANPFQHTSVGPSVPLGPNLVNPIALSWYDADDLLVLDGAGDQTSLWKVPVDGQPATPLPGVLPGAISITANSARNALVVGMTQNRMEVSAGLSGPWQLLGTRGQRPGLHAPPPPHHPPPPAPPPHPQPLPPPPHPAPPPTPPAPGPPGGGRLMGVRAPPPPSIGGGG